MASKRKSLPPTIIRTCYLCGKEIFPEEGDPEYIRTRRGTEIYFHRKCAMGGEGG